ncbi:tigger transposable element-derived protein 2-like [Hydra vulgaris]|uniref:tigger transposable element-derived protein 2-like n=1 Tax=Hydra vulgaris TaxID=6087 RepID=UPI0032E9DE94
MTASWNETTLPTLLLNYKLENIFNADEFGLFYKCLPNKTYHLSQEKCFWGKNSKVRLTGIAAGSATGEKLPMFVIGKSKNPRCFKHIKQLPCTYKNQLKSWMTGDLFTEWAVDNNEPMPKISILQAMKDLVSLWNAESKETVINCFKKAGISKTNKSIEEADDDHLFKFLTEELNHCDVVTTGSLATNAEIIAQILDPNFENNDNEVEDSIDEATDVEAPPRPSDIQLEIAFETIQNTSLYSSKYGNEIQSLALKLEDLMKMEKMDNLKQYKITDFFQKLWYFYNKKDLMNLLQHG